MSSGIQHAHRKSFNSICHNEIAMCRFYGQNKSIPWEIIVRLQICLPTDNHLVCFICLLFNSTFRIFQLYDCGLQTFESGQDNPMIISMIDLCNWDTMTCPQSLRAWPTDPVSHCSHTPLYLQGLYSHPSLTNYPTFLVLAIRHYLPLIWICIFYQTNIMVRKMELSKIWLKIAIFNKHEGIPWSKKSVDEGCFVSQFLKLNFSQMLSKINGSGCCINEDSKCLILWSVR